MQFNFPPSLTPVSNTQFYPKVFCDTLYSLANIRALDIITGHVQQLVLFDNVVDIKKAPLLYIVMLYCKKKIVSNF